MSTAMGEAIKRWTARCKSGRAMASLQGKTTGPGPAGIRSGVDRRRQGGQGKAKPEDSRRCEDRREGDGKAMLELRARIYCRKVKVDD